MTLTGFSASPGFAQGPTVFASFDIDESLVARRLVGRVIALEEALSALGIVAEDFEHQASSLDDESADVLRAIAAIARDPALAQRVREEAETSDSVLTALKNAFDHFTQLLTSVGGYLTQRVPDLREIHRRALACLADLPQPGVPRITAPCVLVARDVSPAVVSLLDPELVLAIVTEEGSPTSHTALLAAQRGIPAVVGCTGILVANPQTVAVNADTGEVLINPTWSAWERSKEQLKKRRLLLAESSGPGKTRDGIRVELLANIGNIDDMRRLGDWEAEGIGLLRTEFLYLNRSFAPQHAEQVEIYRNIFASLPGKKVVVRTLDAGSDKPLRFIPLPPEVNPALGRRGVRQYQEDPTIVRGQLRAIAQAAKESSAIVWTMAPMAATVEEIEWFVDLAKECGIKTVGAMVEVPGLALQPHAALSNCDFASIGSNDLQQYLFAADRQSSALSHLQDGWHPPLWQLVKGLGKAASQLDRPLSLCGLAGGNPILALLAVGAGVLSLSMEPTRLPAVRTALSLHSVEQCAELLEAMLSCTSSAEARRTISPLLHPKIKDLL